MQGGRKPWAQKMHRQQMNWCSNLSDLVLAVLVVVVEPRSIWWWVAGRWWWWLDVVEMVWQRGGREEPKITGGARSWSLR